MKKVRAVIGIACLAGVFTACTSIPHTVSPGVPPELKHSWEVSFNRGDAAAVAALYEPNAQLLTSGNAPIRGSDNIQRAVEGMTKEGLKIKIVDEENVASGDVAYVFGQYRVSNGEGGPEVDQGGFVEVWRRRNGVWAISLDVNASGPASASHSD